MIQLKVISASYLDSWQTYLFGPPAFKKPLLQVGRIDEIIGILEV